jgi:hypothetical protein
LPARPSVTAHAADADADATTGAALRGVLIVT